LTSVLTMATVNGYGDGCQRPLVAGKFVFLAESSAHVSNDGGRPA